MASPFTNAPRGGTTSYYRQPQAGGVPVPPPMQRPMPIDDHEPWFTEPFPNNRMTLSMRSGIPEEMEWALDRLLKLSRDDRFSLLIYPGLVDELFTWPEWYINDRSDQTGSMGLMFSPSPEERSRRVRAQGSLLVLKNASLNEVNVQTIAAHPKTRPLLMSALQQLNGFPDYKTEFMLNALDILISVAPHIILNPPEEAPLVNLFHLTDNNSNRAMIIAAFRAITVLVSKPQNASHLYADNPALEAAIRFLPLYQDRDLLSAALEYLYVHLSSGQLAKAFLMDPRMPKTLKALVSLVIAEQSANDEPVNQTIGEPPQTVPLDTVAARPFELVSPRLEELGTTDEPERCLQWMREVFVVAPDSELTQVDFWNLYKDTFAPFHQTHSLLVAADVIKNVNTVFPTAQAMVLPGATARFVIRGIDRRMIEGRDEKYKCLWDRSTCSEPPFKTPLELYEHVNQHITGPMHCHWGTCPHGLCQTQTLRAHVFTHLPPVSPPQRHPGQPNALTVPFNSPHPTPTPTTRPPPPPPHSVLSYRRPQVVPPPTTLTALLIIRILFRLSFTTGDVILKADEDHFGFPGIEEGEEDEVRDDEVRDGEKRGKRAFKSIAGLMESIRMGDEVFSSWISEMVDAVTERVDM